MQLRGAHDGSRHLGQQPCERDLGHRHAVRLGHFDHALDHARVGFGRGIVLELRIGVFAQALACLARAARQASARKRAVGRQGDSLLGAAGRHLALVLAKHEVHVVLHAHELGESLALGERVGLLELPRVGVGDADVACLAGLHHGVKTLHDVEERRVVIPHVIDVEVHVVHAQVREARIDAVGDVLLAGHAGCDVVSCARQKLRGNHHVIALREVAQGAPQIRLRGAALIGDGRVEEVHACVERALHDLARGLFANRPRVLASSRVTKAHAAQADA